MHISLRAQDPARNIQTHHYASRLNEDVLQCVVFDSPEPNARLIGELPGRRGTLAGSVAHASMLGAVHWAPLKGRYPQGGAVHRVCCSHWLPLTASHAGGTAVHLLCFLVHCTL